MAQLRGGVPQGSVLGPPSVFYIHSAAWPGYSKPSYTWPFLCRWHSVIHSFKTHTPHRLANLTTRLSDINSLKFKVDISEVILLSLPYSISSVGASVTGTKRHAHINPVLASLHWLLVRFWIYFKMLKPIDLGLWPLVTHCDKGWMSFHYCSPHII